MSSRLVAWVPCLVLLGALAPCRAQDAPLGDHVPGQRVYASAALEAAALDPLRERLAQLERGSSWTYRLVLLTEAPRPPLRLAHDLRERWRGREGFDAERAFLIVCSLAEPELAVLPPTPLRDRLALGADALERQFGAPARRRLAAIAERGGAGLGAAAQALAELAAELEDRLSAEASARESRRLEAHEGYQDERVGLEQRALELSQRLERAELRVHDAAAPTTAPTAPPTTAPQTTGKGLDLRAQRHALAQARDAFARGLDALSFAPDRTEAAFREASQLVTQAELTLDQLESALTRVPGARVAQERRLTDLRGHLATVEPEARALAERAADRAGKLLADADERSTEGRPDLALAAVEGAREALDEAVTALQAKPSAPEEGPRPGLLALLLGLGLPSLGLFLWGGALYLGRARAALHAESLLEATERQASGLQREVLALRKLYLRAAEPRAPRVPRALLPEPAPVPRRWRGTTAGHLARARGQIDALHRTWCALQQALARAAISRSQDAWHTARPLEETATILEAVPRRNLPVTEIRECAQRLERLARSAEGCEAVGSSRVDLQACKLEYSIVSPK